MQTLGQIYDLLISMLLTGEERTEEQWRTLLSAEGFALVDITDAGWRSHLLRSVPELNTKG